MLLLPNTNNHHTCMENVRKYIVRSGRYHTYNISVDCVVQCKVTKKEIFHQTMNIFKALTLCPSFFFPGSLQLLLLVIAELVSQTGSRACPALTVLAALPGCLVTSTRPVVVFYSRTLLEPDYLSQLSPALLW